MTLPTDMHMQAGLFPRSQWARLFHAIPQHLIGRNEHDTDDEGHGKGADQTLPDTRLAAALF